MHIPGISMPQPKSQVPPAIRITTPAEFEEAMTVRYAVFCDEQGIAREVERDAADDFATHVLVRDASGQALATGRVMRQCVDGSLLALGAGPGNSADLARIGRMAVRKEARRLGLGAIVIQALEREAFAAGLRSALLHAQVHAAPFYRSCGYVAHGPEFMEEDIPHVEMVKELVE
jgi:predicted GNAT family N-acyltransferase